LTITDRGYILEFFHKTNNDGIWSLKNTNEDTLNTDISNRIPANILSL